MARSRPGSISVESMTNVNPIFLGSEQSDFVTPISVPDVIELCELRSIVEASVGALAAERASEQEIEELRGLAELPYRPGNRETYESYLVANSAFHRALARCSKNHRLESVVMSVLDQLQRPFYLGLDVGLDPAAATAEHLDIIQAIHNRDQNQASFFMTRNIGATKDRILEVVERVGTGSSAG